MKLGLLSAILDFLTFEEVIDFAKENQFECVELACWPNAVKERKYAGVSHLDVDSLDAQKICYINEYCAKNGVSISSLGYYPNTLDENLDKREVYIEHIKKLIDASQKLGIGMVTTFIGRIANKTVEENLKVFKEVWTPIIAAAEKSKVKIAIENCPMLFTEDEWPGGYNLASTPQIWEQMFELIPSEYFGLNYDPSHFIWQQMDYIKPLYRFKERIFHIHIKDIKIHKDKLDMVGIMATPLQYMSPKIPGLGDVDWGKFVSALTDIGYDGCACIEVEDKAFEHSNEAVIKSIQLSRKYISNFIS